VEELKSDPGQHGHLTSDYIGARGLGDIEIFILDQSQPHNMRVAAAALGPGDDIPDAVANLAVNRTRAGVAGYCGRFVGAGDLCR